MSTFRRCFAASSGPEGSNATVNPVFRLVRFVMGLEGAIGVPAPSRLIHIRTHAGSFCDLRFRFQPVLELTARREATSGRTIVSGLRNLPVNFLVRDRHFAFGNGGILFDEWLELRCSLSG